MKIAVIGAGAAGLIAIKYSIAQGYECEAFEQTEVIGGTWNYTDEVGLDKNGLPVQTSMYKHLTTNLPKEAMMFENFPYKENLKESYITQPEVLEYLTDFAERMNLRKYIKFNTLVTYVEPIGNNKWDVELQDVISKKKVNKRFDAVIVANGKYTVPNMPNIPGLETFSGNCIHSHNYRSAEPYTDKVVLVIGAGPSGIDISKQVHRVAKKVIISYSLTSSVYASFIPHGPIQKNLLYRIEKNKVYFENDYLDEIDEIIICTGYVYSFPFLSKKCGVSVDDNYVKGLYKELLCIEFPTMALICIPQSVCPIPTFELQMRFFLAVLNGDFQIPSKDVMLKDSDEKRKAKNWPNRKLHSKGLKGEREYWDDLAETAGVKNVPEVIAKLHQHAFTQERVIGQYFRIINDQEFIIMNNLE